MSIDDKTKDIFKWSIEQYNISRKIDRNPNILSVQVPRYSIYACHLGENIANEKNGHGRPVIVLSSSIILKNNTNIIIAPLSKNIKWEISSQTKKKLKYSYHYVLHKIKYPKLAYDSCIQFEDVRVVSKARLGQYICEVTDSNDVKNIKKRIKEIFGI